ncbi:hypothetical protein ACP4OV_006760 [Aristida adscensionis]
MAHAGAVDDGDDGAGAGETDEEVRLLSVSWNQDSTRFAAATTADLRFFACGGGDGGGGIRETAPRVPRGGGGFAVAEMLFRSDLFVAAVGAGTATTLEVLDAPTGRRYCEHRLPSAVRAVRVSRRHLAVVLDRAIRVYDLRDPARPPLWKIATALNRRGLCCLSCHAGAAVLACPGTARGEVRVDDLGSKAATKLIAAHASDLACIAMPADGTVLATASVTGTVVRVFSTIDGTLLHELRRGLATAVIHSIALSQNLEWLAVSSNKHTLHVFSLRARNGCDEQSSIKGILPNYFGYYLQRSFAQFYLPEVTRYVVAFGEQNTVMVIGMDGSFCRCSFDPVNGGEMVRKEYFRFFKNKRTSN